MGHVKGIFFGTLSVALLLVTAGCVERKLTIDTIPEGATVLLNDENIGQSPATVEFNWYGDYRVQIIKPGYEILNTHRKLSRPAYDYFPLDFFAEILWPGRISDSYRWTFELAKYQPAGHRQLIEAAERMRLQSISEISDTTAIENAD